MTTVARPQRRGSATGRRGSATGFQGAKDDDPNGPLVILETQQKGCKESFINCFEMSLDTELRYLNEVAAGRADARQDERQQYASMLMTALSMASGTLASVAGVGAVSPLIDGMAYLVKKHIQDTANKTVTERLAGVKQSKSLLAEMFSAIAEEVWNRYGAAVLYFIFKPGFTANRTGAIIQGICRVGAIRVLFAALENQTELRGPNVPKLVDGIFDGFSSFPDSTSAEKKIKEGLTDLLKGELVFGTVKLSIQGLYTEPGQLEPEQKFWIKDEQNVLSSLQTAVDAPKPANSWSVFSKKASVPPPAELVKYGFMCVPAASAGGLVRDFTYKQFGTQQLIDCHELPVKLCLGLNNRYVAMDHILAYLKAVKGAPAPGPPTFAAWLISDKKYSQEFQTANLVPMYRGRIDGKTLERNQADFADGKFDGTDFSYCSFSYVKIVSMKGCKIRGATFAECEVVRDAMHFAELLMCTVSGTSFKSTTGVLTLKFCEFSRCHFEGTRLNLTILGMILAP
jgi:hypothetical protein